MLHVPPNAYQTPEIGLQMLRHHCEVILEIPLVLLRFLGLDAIGGGARLDVPVDAASSADGTFVPFTLSKGVDPCETII